MCVCVCCGWRLNGPQRRGTGMSDWMTTKSSRTGFFTLYQSCKTTVVVTVGSWGWVGATYTSLYTRAHAHMRNCIIDRHRGLS